MKKIVLMLAILIAAAATIAPVMAPCPCPPVTIFKEPYCWGGPGWSDNPPYYVGMKYFWWIEITVTANVDLSDVVVYDRLGAELMIEGICEDTPKDPNYDWVFLYTPYERNGDVTVDSVPGTLNRDGISFGSEPFAFDIYWTGRSVKVHFQWNIGDMIGGTSRTIFLVVSTDTNPAGHQEYTSPGCYELNSGATVKALVDGRQVSATAPSIPITVSWPPD
jgi:hypothetical protein